MMNIQCIQPLSYKAPKLKYTEPRAEIFCVPVDGGIITVIGDPDNGAYEWCLVEHGVITEHSDCGYGMATVALRDGMIAYHPIESKL